MRRAGRGDDRADHEGPDDEDVSELVTILHQGRQAWIDGRLGSGPQLDAHRDEAA